ncbi:hypothetical protein CY35_02G174000 [Sphagnum magellanicum]|nr:hypothetical protein CY35_02G174000 [Sphagnum magellanicum]KAH9572865.1 hypothetical protein CY35_02G174000 [Sphagnum magellanicum]
MPRSFGKASIGTALTDSDDAEAQGQDHSWASEVRSTIRNYKNGTAPEVLIRKVPNYLRVPPEQFTPTEWRFGLHSRELDTCGAEGLKIAVAGDIFANEGSDAWDNFCNYVVDDPVRFVRLYGLQDGFTKFSERQVKYLLALDALFLLQTNCRFEGRLNLDQRWYRNCLLPDMVLLENQVPMDVLRKAAENFLTGDLELDSILQSNMEWLCPISFNTSQNPVGAHYPDLVNCSHLLDCVYKTICGPDPPKAEGPYVPIESAVNLTLAGIKIKGVPGTLNMVSFQGGCLSLPIIEIFDSFETVFRNLAIYEYFSLERESHCTIAGYVLLMENLIGNLDDVKLLIKHAVIISYVGPETVVLDTWRSLSKGLWYDKVSASIIEVGEKINKHCKSRKNVIITEFSQLFCSRPWYVVSAIAVTLVTLATLIQTYTSVIGSNKMRPHFPPG